jgi:hypothetical protein
VRHESIVDRHPCGQSVSDRTGSLPAQAGRADVAFPRPHPCTHVPGVRAAQLAGGLQVFSDQRRIRLDRIRITHFDDRRQPPMQLVSFGFQLSLIGHRADQRLMKDVLPWRRKTHESVLELSVDHLVDEFGLDEVVKHRLDTQAQIRDEIERLVRWLLDDLRIPYGLERGPRTEEVKVHGSYRMMC